MKSLPSPRFWAFTGPVAVPMVLLTALAASAQPPGGPPPGGPPMGGPPMMMGGPPMMGGGPWGGDRGGDRRGGWGGGGGGFDPSQFLARMDTNGNGSLDPEEAQGPARFMLERMARNNPKIDINKPIPMSVLTEAIQQARGGGGGGGGFGGPWGGQGGDDENFDLPNQTLVPGFGVKVERPPVPGFGSSGALIAIQVEERDLRDADERMRRYDRNNDGFLDENEIKEARWTDSLSQWDRNRDGRLSRQEVGARYARRREQRQDQESKSRSPEEARGKPQSGESEKDAPSRPFEKISSFRVAGSNGGPARPAGLPEWFTRDDANGDNQVSMNEFARKWDASTLEDFNKFDANSDGYITAKECLAGVKKGYLKGSGPSVPSSESASTGSPSTGASSTGSTSSTAKTATGGGDDFAIMLDWSKKNIGKKDKDKNGFLTPDEFTDSTVKFGDVDANGNGQIDVEEYAKFRQNRSKK